MHAVVLDVVLHPDQPRAPGGIGLLQIKHADLSHVKPLRSEVADQDVATRSVPAQLVRVLETMWPERCSFICGMKLMTSLIAEK